MPRHPTVMREPEGENIDSLLMSVSESKAANIAHIITAIFLIIVIHPYSNPTFAGALGVQIQATLMSSMMCARSSTMSGVT